MKDELKAGQLRTVARGGLEGTVVILLDIQEHARVLTPKNQIWNSYIVFSPSPHWYPGEGIGLRACDLMNW
jgi:hypothetical protein